MEQDGPTVFEYISLKSIMHARMVGVSIHSPLYQSRQIFSRGYYSVNGGLKANILIIQQIFHPRVVGTKNRAESKLSSSKGINGDPSRV